MLCLCQSMLPFLRIFQDAFQQHAKHPGMQVVAKDSSYAYSESAKGARGFGLLAFKMQFLKAEDPEFRHKLLLEFCLFIANNNFLILLSISLHQWKKRN